MAIPALTKTWEFATNRFVSASGYDHEQAHRLAMIAIKQALCDQIDGFYNPGGAAPFIQFVGGTTFRINPNPGTTSYFFSNNTRGNIIGKKIRLAGMTSPGNDGLFTITAQSDIGSNEWVVEYDNPAGVAEQITGSVELLAGNFTNPWRVSWSCLNTGTIGTLDDGVDRIHLLAQLAPATVSGPWAMMCLHNPVTGTDLCFITDTENGAYTGRRQRIIMSLAPNRITPPVNQTTLPAGTPTPAGGNNHVTVNADSSAWYNFSSSTFNTRIHTMMSNDGQQTRMAVCAYGEATIAFMDAVVKNPHPLFTCPGVTYPTVAAWATTSAVSTVWSYGSFNDNAYFRCTDISELPGYISPQGWDKRALVSCYLTTEGYGAAANGQNWTGVNELSGEYEATPCGLMTTNLGVRSRLGEVPDVWYLPTGVGVGHTFPEDNSRQFISLGDIMLPWDGSFPNFG